MAVYQVTNARSTLAFSRANSGVPPPFWTHENFSHPKMPVVAVSWHREAAGYCEWLSAATGNRYRLPAEAEWGARRAAARMVCYTRGAMRPRKWFPDYAKRWKLGPEPVGLYAPNAYGLYNLGDNVHEWCADWYDDGYYAHFAGTKPAGAEEWQPAALRVWRFLAASY